MFFKKRDKSLREMLDTIDGFLATKEGKNLWYILTALRGPDFEVQADFAKDSTTAIIRRHALPRTGYGTTHRDEFVFATWRKEKIDGDSFHFFTHAQAAFVALGLKWNEVNEK
jgi:hypothetical protein